MQHLPETDKMLRGRPMYAYSHDYSKGKQHLLTHPSCVPLSTLLLEVKLVILELASAEGLGEDVPNKLCGWQYTFAG
jgi:hypothetical protein